MSFTTYDRHGRPRQEELPGTAPDTPPPVLKTKTLIGLDLGQRQDFTALAFVERHQLGDEPATYKVRRLRRWRDVAYTAIRDELAERLTAWGMTDDDIMVLDGTGVGVAITDIFAEARRQGRIPTQLESIVITGGFEATRVMGGWHTPKRDLVAAMAVLLEQRRIEVADGMPESAVLRAELGNFRTKVSAAGYDSYAAWREADHDDMVLSVAMAVWYGERGGGRPSYVW